MPMCRLCQKGCRWSMPDLPPRLAIDTVEQLRAASDPVRIRMLTIIQNQPATVKQIADQLGASPGSIGHHMNVLEQAGLAQVVARRLVRGVVAKYFTRTARLFDINLPPEVCGETDAGMDILKQAWEEWAESVDDDHSRHFHYAGLPHVRLTPERFEYYRARLQTLVEDLLAEPPNPHGQVYGMCVALFLAPAYAQKLPPESPIAAEAE